MAMMVPLVELIRVIGYDLYQHDLGACILRMFVLGQLFADFCMRFILHLSHLLRWFLLALWFPVFRPRSVGRRLVGHMGKAGKTREKHDLCPVEHLMRKCRTPDVKSVRQT